MENGNSNGTTMSIRNGNLSDAAVSATLMQLMTTMASLTSGPSTFCMPLFNYVICVVQIAIAAIGFTANLVSMIVFWPIGNETLSSMSFLLIYLAVVDNGVLTFYTLLSAMPPICNYVEYCSYYSQVVFPYLSAFVWPIGTIFNMLSNWTVTLVTLHRYISVCHPHHVTKLASLRVARIQVAMILIGSVIFTIPRFMAQYAVTLPGGSQSILMSTDIGATDSYRIYYTAVSFQIVAYIIPIGTLTFLTNRLIVSLKKFYARREQVTTTGRAENDLTKTLVVVVIVFMTCQILNPIRRLLLAVLPANLLQCESVFSIFSPLTAIGIMFDSAIHFFIYSLCDRRFRGRLEERVNAAARLIQRARRTTKVADSIQIGTKRTDLSVNRTSTNRHEHSNSREANINSKGTTALAVREACSSVHRSGTGTSRVVPVMEEMRVFDDNALRNGFGPALDNITIE